MKKIRRLIAVFVLSIAFVGPSVAMAGQSPIAPKTAPASLSEQASPAQRSLDPRADYSARENQAQQLESFRGGEGGGIYIGGSAIALALLIVLLVVLL